MEQLPSSGGRPPVIEKAIRYAIPLGIGAAIFFFWGLIVPFVEQTLKSTLWTIVYGAPIALIVLTAFFNPKFFVMTYKNIIHKFISFFIKLDPLSYMDRYVEILQEKLANLNKIKVQLKGRKVETERKLKELNAQVEENLKKGAAAKQLKDLSTASLCGSRAAGAQQSIRLYTPNYERMTKSLEFLDLLADNWGMSIIKLKEEVARKREEYVMLRDQARALNQAEAFLSGDTEEGRIYQESLKALEESVTHKIAYIEDFERRSKDIMAGIKVENQMQHDEGLNMLDSYMRDGKLMLPDDYSKPVPQFNFNKIPEAEVVQSNFKLLD